MVKRSATKTVRLLIAFDMNKPRRNHYVPKHYLKAWAFEPCQIYQLDKTVDNCVPKPIGVNDAGLERGLYSHEIEKAFNREIERPAQPVINKLRAAEPLKRTEMMPLVRYMLCQIVRTPRYRDFLTEESILEVRAILDEMTALGIDSTRYGYGEDRIASKTIAGFGRGKGILAAKPARRWSGELFWTAIRLGPVGEFITSDNPMFTWRSDLRGFPRVMIFPVSPKMTLVGSQRNTVVFRSVAAVSNNDTINVAYKKVNDRFSQYVNDTIAGSASRFLYGMSAKPMLAALRPPA